VELEDGARGDDGSHVMMDQAPRRKEEREKQNQVDQGKGIFRVLFSPLKTPSGCEWI
jgi:hypothetical protein